MREWRSRLGTYPIRWSRRAHTGAARPAQVRNNGVRAVWQSGLLRDDDALLFLDGDIVLNDDALEGHRSRMRAGIDLVYTFRTHLTEAQTAAFDAEQYAAKGPLDTFGVLHDPDLVRYGRRNRRHRRLQWVPWQATHRPNLIGCHHAIRAREFFRVNGYDEAYFGFASEDDDLSRRLNRLRPQLSTANAVMEIMAYHLWHPSRDTPDRKKEAAYLRFKRDDQPVFARFGLISPAPQPEVEVTELE